MWNSVRIKLFSDPGLCRMTTLEIIPKSLFMIVAICSEILEVPYGPMVVQYGLNMNMFVFNPQSLCPLWSIIQ
jgi:hypothetical protein